MKESKTNFYSKWLIGLVFALFSIPCISFADTTLHSSTALDTILQQTEETYLRALGSNKQEALNKAPEVFANLVGLTMQQQFKHLRNNKYREYFSRFEALQDEALAFMGQLAKAHNYRHPIDGSNMPADRLRVAFYNGRNMDTSNVRFGNLNPNDVRLPFMLSQVPLPESTGGEHGALVVKPKNELNFLGVVAPPAESNDQLQSPPKPDNQTGNCSGIKQLEGGCQCPQQPPQPLSPTASTFFHLDCNGDPCDKTYVQCEYNGTEQGPYLKKQIPHMNGERHGTVYTWRINSKTRRPYLVWEQNYFSGKLHGIWTMWDIEQKSGRVYLENKTPYINGKKHGISIDYRQNGSVNYRGRYIDGKFIETLR